MLSIRKSDSKKKREADELKSLVMAKIYQYHPHRLHHNMVADKANKNRERSAKRNIICTYNTKLTSTLLSHHTNKELKPKSRCFVCQTFSNGLNCATGRYNRKNCRNFEINGKLKCQLCIRYRSKQENELNCGMKNVYAVHVDCKYFEFDGTRKN